MKMRLCGRYRPKWKLGEALYGDVWLCEDEWLAGAEVAIKKINLRRAKQMLFQNPNIDNPWQERVVFQHLSHFGAHPNLVQYHGHFWEPEATYVVMEYCNGGDLHQLLEQDLHFAERVALHMFAQIAKGVCYLHLQGIAHRDLSLENVMIHDHVCKLGDFGLSTLGRRTCKGRVGKAYYMAPEVVANSEYNPMAADVWSLGIILFVMLTGAPLVRLADAQDHAFLILRTFGIPKILDAWHMTSRISPPTLDLLTGMLQVNPTRRPSIREVLQHAVLQGFYH